MKLIKEIKSKSGEVHFRRWEILKTRWGSIWLHAIYKADQDNIYIIILGILSL